jgi:uncharacterized protein (TIGR03067 family)
VIVVSSAVLASAPGGKEAKPLPVALGMSTADVEAKLGKPQETASTPDGCAVWKYQDKDTRVEISFEAGRVARILQAAVGDDAKEIQGTWKVVSLAVDGKPETDVTQFAIGGGKMTPLDGPSLEDSAQYRLDSTAAPKRIDLIVPEGTVHGIYSLASDDLKMCLVDKPGAARPEEFGSKAGSGMVMLVLKRQSRDWKHPAASKPGAKEKAAVEAAGPNLVKVSGTVKFKDGSTIPLPEKGAKARPPIINFTPVGEAVPGQRRKGAGGMIGGDGHFDLMTFKPGDGVIPGKYAVSIIAHKIYGDPKSSLVPEKYTNPKTSGLEFSIERPMSDIVIELDKP